MLHQRPRQPLQLHRLEQQQVLRTLLRRLDEPSNLRLDRRLRLRRNGRIAVRMRDGTDHVRKAEAADHVRGHRGGVGDVAAGAVGDAGERVSEGGREGSGKEAYLSLP